MSRIFVFFLCLRCFCVVMTIKILSLIYLSLLRTLSIELRVFTDKIKLWNGLSIGMSRDVLISLLGKPVLNKVGRLFFKVGDGQYLDARIDEQNIVYALQLFRSEKDFSDAAALQEHAYDFYEPR